MMNNPSNNPIRASRMTPLPSSTPAQRPEKPIDGVLRFAPLAWLKLRLFLHADDVEVGAFGISSEDDLLYIEDIATVKQFVTAVSVEFDDASVADHFDRCADTGISPSQCGRLWIHTHPGSSPLPSAVDERTFKRSFGDCDWSSMVIVARGGETYCRLHFAAGPSGNLLVPVQVDWEEFPQALLDREGQLDELFTSWLDEYGQNVHQAASVISSDLIEPQRRCDVFDELDDLHERTWWDDALDSWSELFDSEVQS